jgi:hypothetical protein
MIIRLCVGRKRKHRKYSRCKPRHCCCCSHKHLLAHLDEPCRRLLLEGVLASEEPRVYEYSDISR